MDDNLEGTQNIPFTELSPGIMFGRYRIEEEIGRGGMGVVYKAFDTKLNVVVALKLIIKDEDQENVKRFLRETSAVAQLNHRNIIRFYEAGERPRPYFTMEYIEGVTLSDFIKRKKVKLLWLLEVMIEICEGLFHAHKNNILHRDIKPSNIMIAKGGTPKIMDFGLAKLADASTNSLSQEGQIFGTVHYMAPEQVQGKTTYKSDIYSLGATMYEALTYKTVFQSDTQLKVAYMVLHDDPIPLKHINSNISPYMEAICLKCLEKDANNRYRDCKQLAKELKNFKQRRPIIAKKYTHWSTIKNFVSKNKTLFISVVLLVVALCVFLGISLQQNKEIRRQQKLAAESLEKTEQTNEKLQEQKKITLQALEYAEKVNKKLKQEREKQDQKQLKKAESYIIRGNQYKKQGKYKEAEEAYGKAIKLMPNLASAYLNRGVLYYSQKLYSKAEKDYNQALVYEETATAYYNRGIVYIDQNKLVEAEQDYKKAIALEPTPKIYTRLGTLYKIKNKIELAEKNYKLALSLDPNHITAHINMGVLYLHTKNYKLAIKSYNQAILLRPKGGTLYKPRAYAYYQLGKYQLAYKDCQRAIKLGQQNDRELQNLMRAVKQRIK